MKIIILRKPGNISVSPHDFRVVESGHSTGGSESVAQSPMEEKGVRHWITESLGVKQGCRRLDARDLK